MDVPSSEMQSMKRINREQQGCQSAAVVHKVQPWKASRTHMKNDLTWLLWMFDRSSPQCMVKAVSEGPLESKPEISH